MTSPGWVSGYSPTNVSAASAGHDTLGKSPSRRRHGLSILKLPLNTVPTVEASIQPARPTVHMAATSSHGNGARTLACVSKMLSSSVSTLGKVDQTAVVDFVGRQRPVSLLVLRMDTRMATGTRGIETGTGGDQ